MKTISCDGYKALFGSDKYAPLPLPSEGWIPANSPIRAQKEIVGSIEGKTVRIEAGTYGQLVKKNREGSLYDYHVEFNGTLLQCDKAEIECLFEWGNA